MWKLKLDKMKTGRIFMAMLVVAHAYVIKFLVTLFKASKPFL